jgi:hypothetical protein
VVKNSEKYKGKSIVYNIPDDNTYVGEIELTIDGEHVHVVKMQDGNYGAHLLPYNYYTSVIDLAHDVIDKTPQFSGRLHRSQDMAQ